MEALVGEMRHMMRTKLEQIHEQLDRAENTNQRPPGRQDPDQPRHAARQFFRNSTKEMLKRLRVLMGV